MTEEMSAAEVRVAKLLASGFRHSDLALVLMAADGGVLKASRGAELLLGCAEDRILDSDFRQRFTDPAGVWALFPGQEAAGGEEGQFDLRRADGNTLPVEIKVSRFVMTDAEGVEAIHAVLTLRDVQERQHEDELRAARLAKLDLLNQVSEALFGARLDLDQILQAVLICMTAGQGLRFNRAFLLLVDGPANELQGRMAIGPSDANEAAQIWHDLAHQPGDLFELVTRYDQSISETDVAVNEIVRRMNVSMSDHSNILVRVMAEGHACCVNCGAELPGAEMLYHWLGSHEVAIAPMSTRRGPVGVIVADNAISGTPITDLDMEFLQMFANQSAGAIENSRLYGELEQRLRDLHAAHEKQRQDQETLLKMERLSVMGETSAIVAHELRNPLVAIGGFARSLTRSIEPGDPNRVAATIIAEEVGRMERIIHDLLDFIRPPKMLRTALVVDEIVAQAAQKYQARAAESDVELVVDLQAGELKAAMNPGEIQQVLHNFLTNALQALDGPGRVVVRTRGVEGGISVAVLDDGPGFAPELAEKLKAPFFSTKPTGSGLGLTICVQIIKAHNGAIVARNRPEGGAEFSFILPIYKDEEGVENPA